MDSLESLNIRNRLSLIFYFAILNIKIRFKNTYLGFLWAALEPLFYFSILYLVFTNIRPTGDDFAIYLITGVMLFHIFARGTTGGMVSIIGNSGLIKSLKIKMDFFPIVATLAIAILSLVDVGVFLALMPIFQFIPSWTIILLPIPLFLLFILILGLSYLLSILTVFARDILNLWTIFVHALLFVSPIFWNIDDVGGILIQIQKINPLGQLIEISHELVIYGQIPPINDWLYTSVFVFAIFLFGYFVFQKFQNKVTEEL